MSRLSRSIARIRAKFATFIAPKGGVVSNEQLAIQLSTTTEKLAQIEAAFQQQATERLTWQTTISQQISGIAQSIGLLQSEGAHKVLLATDREVVVTVPGYFLVFPTTQLNHALSYLNPMFDAGMRIAVTKHTPVGGVYVDIGANVGVLSAIGARVAGPSGMVVTVEPIPGLQEVIGRNVFLNAVMTPHQHHTVAVADQRGITHFDVFRLDSRISTLFAYGSHEKNDQFDRIEVKTCPLSDIVPDDSRPMLIKIDAEGAEVILLRQLAAMRDTLRRRKTKVILEFTQEHFHRAGSSGEEFLSIMQEAGLKASFLDMLSGEEVCPVERSSLDRVGNVLIRFE